MYIYIYISNICKKLFSLYPTPPGGGGEKKYALFICFKNPKHLTSLPIPLHFQADGGNNKDKTRRLGVLSNTKLYHQNLLLLISAKFAF